MGKGADAEPRNAPASSMRAALTLDVPMSMPKYMLRPAFAIQNGSATIIAGGLQGLGRGLRIRLSSHRVGDGHLCVFRSRRAAAENELVRHHDGRPVELTFVGFISVLEEIGQSIDRVFRHDRKRLFDTGERGRDAH